MSTVALVLRDRTKADPQQVFVTALDDLVALGAWTHRRARRLPSLRLTDELTPSAETPDLPEPLRTVDATLRRAAVDLGALTTSAAGTAALTADPPPERLSALAARLLDVIEDTPTGAHGFAWGAIGTEVAGYGHTAVPGNREAALRYGRGF